MSEENCLFCKIMAGDSPADIVYESDTAIAFRDINPQAPTHFLVIPREHVKSLATAGEEQGDLLGALLLAARDAARAQGMADDGYRTVINVGADGGQTVHHLHVHVLGGRALAWPPG